MEPQWTKKISSETVCTTYYYIFALYVFIAVLAFIGTIFILLNVKMSKSMAVAFGFQGLLSALIASILALFQYLVCSRALLGQQTMEVTVRRKDS